MTWNRLVLVAVLLQLSTATALAESMDDQFDPSGPSEPPTQDRLCNIRLPSVIRRETTKKVLRPVVVPQHYRQLILERMERELKNARQAFGCPI